MLATLPALRNPSTSADRLPDIRYVQNWLRFQRADVYARFVRARVADGTTYYLVPAARLGHPPLSPAAAERCYRLALAALRAKLPTYPRAKRAATFRYADAWLSVYRYRLETSSVHEGVFLLSVYRIPVCPVHSRVGSGTTSCGEAVDGGQTLAAIRRAGLLNAGRLGPPGSPWVVSGIVPAGVASVAIHYPATNHGSQRLPTLNVTGDVINDIFAIPVSTLSQRGWRPTTATWYSSSGKVIKTINER
jgi:hypothetical protein